VAGTRAGRALAIASNGPEDTYALGERLAAAARPGDLLCLWGDLGAGKTVFAKGFGRGLGVTGTVSSPSFILMAEYPARLRLFHIDLYRLAGPDEAVGGGLLDDRQVEGVTLVEWPDRLGPTLPPERLDVRIEGTGDGPRRITLEAGHPALDRYLEAATPEARPEQPATERVGGSA
jgi:tRNA threonylcarbamoyladenosine biosynthesis protein TsaE